MRGLVPRIHVLLNCGLEDVDARHKAGHDKEESRLGFLYTTTVSRFAARVTPV